MSNNKRPSRTRRFFNKVIPKLSSKSRESSTSASAKEVLQTTWHGIVYLLKNVEKCLDGTPFKAPVAAINIVIDLGNTVIDNKDTLQELLTRTTDRLQNVNLELTKDKDTASKEMKERFVGKLVAELVKLEKMSGQAPWRRLLDNEENKNKIEETLKQIDDHIKDLQLYTMIRMDRNIHNLTRGLTRLELGSWPHSAKARYDASFEKSTLLIREPCTEGTRTSILADIYQWATSPDTPSIFWLTGEAGSGKSTLACTVAKYFDDDGNILGGNFFCSRQFGETREQGNIIPTIVYHLARKSRSFAQALLEADRRDSVDRVVPKQIEDLLIGPWQNSTSERGPDFPPYLVILDALDEINGLEGSAFLAELLKAINAKHLPGLKFLVTSRPDPNIVRLCESFPSETVCRLYDVPRADVRDDITTYLKARLPALKDDEQLTRLADKADGLFIYAATAVRYITPRPHMAAKEQRYLISKLLPDPQSTIPNRISPPAKSGSVPPLIDELYKQILGAAFTDLEDNDLLQTRLSILHTILCTQERVSTSVAAALQADSDDMEDIADVVVKDLHAVLYVKNGCVFWYHASFPDFIFDSARSTFTLYTTSPNTPGREVDMSCDKASQHTLLTRSCFRIMMSPSPLGLRFNICELPSSFLLDSEVADLEVRIERNISNVLRYCVHYWAQHLAQATSGKADDLFTCIEKFLRTHVLFWIEVMNLLRSSALCTSMLHQARKTVLECANEPSTLARDLSDVANFATYFTASPAASSTPHLYISSLATWSKNSAAWQHWKSQFPLLPSFTRTSGKGGHSVPLMTIRTDHSILCVAFSNDGRRIVSGSSDNSVRVWDASNGAQLEMLSGHTDRVISVAFSTDGTRIVSGSLDNSVRVWDASNGSQLEMLSGHTNRVMSVAFSTDGTRIVSGSLDNSVRVWDASNGAQLEMLSGHTDTVMSVAFSTDGTRIVSGSSDNSLRVWDASNGSQLEMLSGHTDRVMSVAFSTDGTRIVSGSSDNSVRVWDASNGAQLEMLSGHTDRVISVAFSTDGTRIASGSWDNSVRVWDASNGSQLEMLSGHTDRVMSVAFSTDGTRIVSGSEDNSVRVWDASNGAQLEMLSGHTDAVVSVAFSTDGTRIVSGSLDNSVRVWDASNGSQLEMLSGHTDRVMSVAFSTDGTRIVSGSWDNSVRVWDASNGAQLEMLSGHTDTVMSVAFSTDGTRIVSGSWDNSVRVWDASNGAQLEMLSGHTDRVMSVAFSTDGTRIVSGSWDNSVRVWDASNGSQLEMLSGHTDRVMSVAFSTDGTRIVSGSWDNSVRVWDASNGAQLEMLSGHTDTVMSVAFSTDGTRIVSGSWDNSVRVWDASNGSQLEMLSGHTDRVMSVAFSTDGTRIVSGSLDNSVRVWDVSNGAQVEMLSGHTQSVYSVAFSTDGTRIVSGSRDTSVREWDLQHDDYLRWMSDGQNWIVTNPGGDRLVWLPSDLLRVLNRPFNTLTISREGSAQIDFSGCRIGSDWAKCYTSVLS